MLQFDWPAAGFILSISNLYGGYYIEYYGNAMKRVNED